MHSPRARLGQRLHRWVWELPDDEEFVRRFNIANRHWRHSVALTYDSARRLFLVHDGGDSVAVARRSRLIYYFHGIEARERQLRREYFLDDVPLSTGDLVIDIGANVGEVSRLLHRRSGVTCLAFEPSEPEFRALEMNLSDAPGTVWNRVLWSSEADITFYDANDTGDSSVFATPNARGSSQHRATTLDAALSESTYRDAPVKLMKLEAEGAEPEIVEGAARTLERVEHIVADVGPERGAAKASTLIRVYELLHAKGFHARRVAFKRPVMMFSRR